uniref:Uncharacterized protein n=1 Tax=Aegilops tauschii subsp. strangulata TaxID=200361 RepID=A0A453GW46_AEGTS
KYPSLPAIVPQASKQEAHRKLLVNTNQSLHPIPSNLEDVL